MKKYICQYCGKSTYDVDIDYLVGYDHLSCNLERHNKVFPKKKKQLEISNWAKLSGNKFDVMGASFIIMDAEDTGDIYTAWVHPIDDTQPFVRVTLFSEMMDMQVKVVPPLDYNGSMTPYDLTSTITKHHISNPSIFIQTIGEALLSDSTTRDVLSYISRKQDTFRFKGRGYTQLTGTNGSSGNNLW